MKPRWMPSLYWNVHGLNSTHCTPNQIPFTFLPTYFTEIVRFAADFISTPARMQTKYTQEEEGEGEGVQYQEPTNYDEN